MLAERSTDPRPTRGSRAAGAGAVAGAGAPGSSHYRPRSRRGWLAVVAFLGLLALTQPPFVHSWANRIEPWLLGFPFLYAYLLIIYSAMIAVLIWAYRRGV